eukprot:294587-Prorocentrum_minimum.AAC.1
MGPHAGRETPTRGAAASRGKYAGTVAKGGSQRAEEECDAARTENEALQCVHLVLQLRHLVRQRVALAVVGLEPGALRQHTAIAS